MMKAILRARYLLVGACLLSCLAVACGDDDDSAGPAQGGSAGSAGESTGDAGMTSSSSGKGNGGRSASAGSGGTAATGGMPPEPAEAGAGGMPANPDGFTAFVHELIQHQTADTTTPKPLEQFADPQDEHGHYLVPASDFDDLF